MRAVVILVAAMIRIRSFDIQCPPTQVIKTADELSSARSRGFDSLFVAIMCAGPVLLELKRHIRVPTSTRNFFLQPAWYERFRSVQGGSTRLCRSRFCRRRAPAPSGRSVRLSHQRVGAHPASSEQVQLNQASPGILRSPERRPKRRLSRLLDRVEIITTTPIGLRIRRLRPKKVLALAGRFVTMTRQC